MELIRFTTEEHEIAGAYPSGMTRQLSGTGFTLRDRNNCMYDHRNMVDKVVTGVESEMLNSRESHNEFTKCRTVTEAALLVTGNLKRYLLKNHPGHQLHRESFGGIRDKVTASLWDVWKNDEAERS
jgi:formylmethanofuran dehydrogenase subunit A